MQEIAERVGIIRKGLVVETAEVQNLIRRSLTRLKVTFASPTEARPLEQIRGVKVLARDSTSATLQVEGEMDSLVKTLAQFPVRDLETERPSLEEIFMTYYEEN